MRAPFEASSFTPWLIFVLKMIPPPRFLFSHAPTLLVFSHPFHRLPQRDMTSLLNTSKSGQIAIALALLEAGAEVEAKDQVRRRRAGCDETRWHSRESECVLRGKGLLRCSRYMYPAQWPGRVLHATLASSLAFRGGEASMP